MKSRAEPPASPRRIPRQERGRKRFEAILDAAAEAFAETGYEAATTQAIAARADSSIGSLYQFFPNKRALFRAMVERSYERAVALFAELLSPDATGRAWPQLLDAVIDAFAEFQRRDAGARAVWINLQLYEEFAEADRSLTDVFVRGTEAIVALNSPHLPAEKHLLMATMVVQIISTTFFHTARHRCKGTTSGGALDFDEAMIAETKVAVRRYLSYYRPERA